MPHKSGRSAERLKRAKLEWNPEWVSLRSEEKWRDKLAAAKAKGGSLHGEGVDLIGDDFDFDGEGRARIVSVHDGAAHENVSGELLELQGIEDGAATGIDDHGMRGLKSVIGRKLR